MIASAVVFLKHVILDEAFLCLGFFSVSFLKKKKKTLQDLPAFGHILNKNHPASFKIQTTRVFP